VLNTGFAGGQIAPDAIEERAAPAPGPATGIVAYARLIGLEAGDVVGLQLTGPDGKPLAATPGAPLDHDKAQWVVQVGRGKAPSGGWPHGPYTAQVEVRRNGAVALSSRWQTTL
jgi:hypothetical protein